MPGRDASSFAPRLPTLTALVPGPSQDALSNSEWQHFRGFVEVVLAMESYDYFVRMMCASGEQQDGGGGGGGDGGGDGGGGGGSLRGSLDESDERARDREPICDGEMDAFI